MRQPQELTLILSEFPRNLVNGLIIATESANVASSAGYNIEQIEKVIEALLGAALFSGLAVECSNKYFVEYYVKANPEAGMLFVHRVEQKAFFIASKFIYSLNFKEHASRILGDRF